MTNKCIPGNGTERERLKHILIITLAFFLIHGFELILTGTFHDDWLSWFHDYATKDMEGWMSGRPYYSLIIELVWLLPGYGYRILGFLTYYAIALTLYDGCGRLDLFDDRASLCITLIYIAVPCNDARVLLANYPYALGLLLFFIAFDLLIVHVDRLTIPCRCLTLLLFFLSFTLNSNLMLYAIVILFILCKKKRHTAKYLDYIVLPFAFYGLNHLFFPVYGDYANYNTVTAERLLETMKLLPNTVLQTLNSLSQNWHGSWLVNWLCIVLGMAVYGLQRLRPSSPCQFDAKRPKAQCADAWDHSKRQPVALIGLLCVALGVIPYALIRDNHIYTVGIQGRDSIQVALGAALMLYSLVSIAENKLCFIIPIIILGFVFFNDCCIEYQKEAYIQMNFQAQIASMDPEPGVYIVDCEPDTKTQQRRFYTWSGSAAAATGRRDMFFLNGQSDAHYIENATELESILSRYPMFRDFDGDALEVRATVVYRPDLSNGEVIALKALELFDHQEFERRMENIGRIAMVDS